MVSEQFNIDNGVVDTYLVVDLLVEGLESVAEALRLEIFVEEHLSELGDHSVEDGGRDLGRVDV